MARRLRMRTPRTGSSSSPSSSRTTPEVRRDRLSRSTSDPDNLTTTRFTVGALGVVAFWFAARVVYWNGYYVEDAPGYVTDAIWMALGEYRARDYVNGLNVGTYLPVSLPILLLGK